MPPDEAKDFRIDSDSENEENEENLAENPKKVMPTVCLNGIHAIFRVKEKFQVLFRYWANKRWKGKIAECPVYTLPATGALPRSTDFGLTHVNVLVSLAAKPYKSCASISHT